MSFLKWGMRAMTAPLRVGAEMARGGMDVAEAMVETGRDIATGQDPVEATFEGMQDVASATFRTGFEVAKEPLRVMSRGVDAVTGQDNIDLSDAHVVMGHSAAAFADEFMDNPTALSPIGVGVHRVSDIHYGRPFPGGPELGIQMHERRDQRLPDVRSQSIIELSYLGDEIHGQGRLVVTENGDGTLTVEDHWIDVENDAPFPTVMQEALHKYIAGAGLDNIAARALKRSR